MVLATVAEASEALCLDELTIAMAPKLTPPRSSKDKDPNARVLPRPLFLGLGASCLVEALE